MHKDQHGYGLTLSGDQPVSVQTVKPGGAAERAGIRENDVILKVNGKRVTGASHDDVVELIQGENGIDRRLAFEMGKIPPPTQSVRQMVPCVPVAFQAYSTRAKSALAARSPTKNSHDDVVRRQRIPSSN